MEHIFDIISDQYAPILSAIIVAYGYALLFNTPYRAIWMACLLGGIGFTMKTIMFFTLFHGNDIVSTCVGSLTVGFLSVYFAHKVHTPPIVFTIPSVIMMVPGKIAYLCILDFINIVSMKSNAVSEALLIDAVGRAMQVVFILMGLAFGIIAPMILFNTYTVKEADLDKILMRRLRKAEQMLKKK